MNNYKLGQSIRYINSLEKRKNKWITECNKIHSYYYDYSKVCYQNQLKKVEIICTVHGSFFQRPADHKNQKQGCPKCSHNFPITHEEFCKKSKSKFGNKFKITSKFNGIKKMIDVECSIHGSFSVKAENHLLKDGGCKKCVFEKRISNLKPGNISKKEKEWLDKLRVPLRQERLTINGKVIIVDGFDPSTNTIYEYYGSYWHGDPVKYNPLDINTKLNKTFKELYETTIKRENLIKTKFNLITKWED